MSLPLVLDLLNYIEQVEKLKIKPAFNVPTEFFLAAQEDLQGLPEVQFNIQDEEASISVACRRDSGCDRKRPSLNRSRLSLSLRESINMLYALNVHELVSGTLFRRTYLCADRMTDLGFASGHATARKSPSIM